MGSTAFPIALDGDKVMVDTGSVQVGTTERHEHVGQVRGAAGPLLRPDVALKSDGLAERKTSGRGVERRTSDRGLVLVPAALMWAIFIVAHGTAGQAAAPSLGIPRALRPAESDEKLEGPRLERILVWGVISTFALAIFIPAYWLPERERQEHFEERFDEESVHRGGFIYQTPPELEEDIDAIEFKELEEEIALGQNCAFCHGGAGPRRTGT